MAATLTDRKTTTLLSVSETIEAHTWGRDAQLVLSSGAGSAAVAPRGLVSPGLHMRKLLRKAAVRNAAPLGLILPYERFVRGEEDKPLPPVKARKQELEVKTEGPDTEPIQEDTKRGAKEKRPSQKSQKPSEVSLELEKSQDNGDAESSLETAKKPPEETLSLAPEVTELVELEKVELSEGSVKAEGEDLQPGQDANAVLAAKGELESDPIEEHSETRRDRPSAAEPEEMVLSITDSLGTDLREAPSHVFPDIQAHVQNQNCMDSDHPPHLPDYIANCTVKVGPLGTGEMKSPMDSDILKNALKKNTKVYVVQSLDVFKEKEVPIAGNDNPAFNFTPLLYSRGNPGIMSPLAKKKLLSQVSVASVPSSYPYGSPPPLIRKKRLNGRDELCASGLQTIEGCNTEPTALNRPSVIQHVQSFKTKYDEERAPPTDPKKQNLEITSEAYHCEVTKHHPDTAADSCVSKPDTNKMPGPQPHVSSSHFDFYSSPHLHKLHKQAEHHLHREKVTRSLAKDLLQDSEKTSSFAQHKHLQKRSPSHRPPFHYREKPSREEALMDDRPTDLSLPKNINLQSTKMHGASLPQHEGENVSSKYKPDSHTASSDCYPKACRISPMPTSDSNPRLEPSHNSKHNGLGRVEATVHPMPSSKTINVGMARPLKRSPGDLLTESSEKKIRIVSPLHLPKESSGREKCSTPVGERSKSVHDLHSDSVLDNHKYPISSPMFPGLYPGSLCTGLNSRFPASFSNPLQYLKNQTVYSSVMPPITLQSFMMQRQFLSSSANSQQLYRHLAAGTPIGSSYGDLLHNNMYPLASINPPNAFPSSQLSSAHPSTKL